MLMLSQFIFKTSTYHMDHPVYYLVHQGCQLCSLAAIPKNFHEPIFECQFDSQVMTSTHIELVSNCYWDHIEAINYFII